MLFCWLAKKLCQAKKRRCARRYKQRSEAPGDHGKAIVKCGLTPYSDRWRTHEPAYDTLLAATITLRGFVAQATGALRQPGVNKGIGQFESRPAEVDMDTRAILHQRSALVKAQPAL